MSCPWRHACFGVVLAAVHMAATQAVFADTAVIESDRAESAAWRSTLERIASGVVAIKVDSTRAFDTEWNESSQATGFVVDARRGLILTNRHVVSSGPVRAEALFINQEEVELTPVYRDPVHDFGFFRYDPAKLRYIEPVEFPLAPERAQVGREIRVVGNDAGEQLSILSGTIARLRRPAPTYGRGKYNDFNTFYLQAASGTSGGSSGSPVIDIDGRAVALNAGGSNAAASSFFLPLDRVTRALALVREGRDVARGTVGVIFEHLPFDELGRLGLQEDTEAEIRRRFQDQTGMLVVGQVIPGSPADSQLRVGDILVRIGEDYVTEYVSLEAVLDEHIGEPLRLGIERNGLPLETAITVQDLDEVTPREYLRFGDAVVHDLSLQQARHYNRPVEGVFVANPGYVLGSAAIPRSSIIVNVNEAPIGNLDDLEAVLAGMADQQRAAVRFFTLEDPATSRLQAIRMDRHWFPAERCRRDDASGVWPCRTLAAGPPAVRPQASSTRLPRQRDERLERVASSLVLVNFDMPYAISGVADQHYYGTGVIVDAERGFVAVDRNTVPEAMGDVQVTFGGSLEIPGRVAYIHPAHNLALVAYDPALIGDTPVQAARLIDRLPQPGDDVQVIGLRRDYKLIHRATQVASLEPVSYPLSRTIRFRETNLETLALVNGPTDVDGVIVDRRGDVVALWSSFSYQSGGDVAQENRGVPADLVRELVTLAREERALRSLEVEWVQLPLAAARKLGLPDEWARRLQEHDPERAQVLSVVRTVAGAPAAALLQPGDLLLGIEGQPVTRPREAERASQADQVELLILRDGAALRRVVRTTALSGRGVDRAVMWAGALLQAPYREMAAQRGVEPYGVYVAFFAYGSPASRYGLLAGRRIVEVDGQPTPDLDSFLAATRGRRDGDPVRLTTVSWNNFTDVLTLKLDPTYWPAYEIVRGSDGWGTQPLE
ncbi:MAG: trypsin-like peptidase domain-containing protein [Gammaproteobacteria bacterium]|nr:trypsin-like peptidase domain-containing protein [Gammaproteobacteria bacterium]